MPDDTQTETLAELEVRLMQKYAKPWIKGLDQAEYRRQVALMTAPPRRPIPVIDKHVAGMTRAEYQAALAKLGIRRRF